MSNKVQTVDIRKKTPNLFGLLRPYMSWVVSLIVLTVLSNALNLAVPKIISRAIDTFSLGSFVMSNLLIEFSIIAVLIFAFTYLQNIVQVYTSEKVARDLRNDLSVKISTQSYAYVEEITPAKLLTNLTSDIDSIKSFVSQAIASIISSAFLIFGASALLLYTDWKLALAVLTIVPIIGFTFYYVFSKVKKLFKKQQEAIDWLNKVISESILGAALIRLLNSEQLEYEKFLKANTEARNIGMSILRLFAGLMPTIMFCTNIAVLIILCLGGHFVISGTMSLGDFTAFNSYLAILVFPIIIIGFMSTVIAQASASYARIIEVLTAPGESIKGSIKSTIHGDIAIKDLNLKLGNKSILKNVTFPVGAGSKVAIIGPTAAGKTQLLYLLIGLTRPTSGEIYLDGLNINEYDKEGLHSQIGFVFQDSVMFNLSLRENIAFSNTVTDDYVKKAIDTAELHDFIDTLPQGLDTVVSERGTSLSGGQKQRVMLARALALNPRVLFLDDFTARVDTKTEQKILNNISKNYPAMTLISVTQKISSVEHYDEIILLMEGEILAKGSHDKLLESSTEYAQIYESQKSTNHYE